MIRSEITMTGGGGDSFAPAIGAREERDVRRRQASESARGGAGVNVGAAMRRRRGRRAFALPTWFNIAATVAVAAAIAVGVLIQG